MNTNFQLARDKQRKEFSGVVLELLAGLEVSEQGWASNFDAFRGETARFN